MTYLRWLIFLLALLAGCEWRPYCPHKPPAPRRTPILLPAA